MKFDDMLLLHGGLKIMNIEIFFQNLLSEFDKTSLLNIFYPLLKFIETQVARQKQMQLNFIFRVHLKLMRSVTKKPFNKFLDEENLIFQKAEKILPLAVYFHVINR